MHLDYSSVGNHEFDEGEDELKRMQNGGCHPVDGCKDGTPFDGANFSYLSANVIDKRTGKPFFRPYAVRRFHGVKLGIIGMTLEGTAGIVSPAGIKDLQFLDEADTANKYAKELRRRYGVKAIVVLLHEGGAQSGVPLNAATINSCDSFSGPVTDIVNRTTKAVDVFITAHTHQAYNCSGDNAIDGRPVTSAASNGRVLTDLDLTISKRTGDVTHVDAENIATQTYTGAQLLDVLKDQWCGTNSSPTVLLPSSTIHYRYNAAAATAILGKPCDTAANPVSDVTIGGAPLDPAASYRITTNNFLADGGDDFPSLKLGTGRTTLPDFDIDSLVRYLQPSLTGAPIGPPALDRITLAP